MTTSCVLFSYDAGCLDVDSRDAATGAGDHRDARLVGRVGLPVHGERRDVDEVAGVGVEVAVEALELEPQHAAHDVEAGLVEVVVVPAADGSRLRW